MKHLRADYDAIQPFPTKRKHFVVIDGQKVEADDEHLGKHMDPIIPDDEPVFLIRSKDIVGPRIVELWAHNARSEGADDALCDRVLEFAMEMQEYARVHYNGGKAPDTPEGMLR